MQRSTLKTRSKPILPSASIVLLISSTLASTGSWAFSYATDVRLQDLVETTLISGFEGAEFVVESDSEIQAMYGLTTRERYDNPCSLTLHTEDANESTGDENVDWNWCGENGATSSNLTLSYDDIELNQPRLFVHGIRLCMNRSARRLKGYQLSGKRISDTGFAEDIPIGESELGTASGSTLFSKNSNIGTPATPSSIRSNCSQTDWMPWARCSRPNQVATGLEVHVSAGKTPRSITGIALRCQIVSAVRP